MRGFERRSKVGEVDEADATRGARDDDEHAHVAAADQLQLEDRPQTGDIEWNVQRGCRSEKETFLTAENQLK